MAHLKVFTKMGDQVLKTLTSAINKNTREADSAASSDNDSSRFLTICVDQAPQSTDALTYQKYAVKNIFCSFIGIQDS